MLLSGGAKIMLYKTKCAKCGKEMFTYAKDKLGNLPIVFCSTACEANARNEKRFIKLNR